MKSPVVSSHKPACLRVTFPLLGLLLTGVLHAQNPNGTGQGGNGNPGASRKPAIDVRPTVIPSTTTTSVAPTTPARPDKSAPAPAVTEAIQKAQVARTDYLQALQAEARLSKTSSTEDRQAIREQMKENLQRLREAQSALRKEVRERVEELKTELSPDFGRVLADVGSEGRGR